MIFIPLVFRHAVMQMDSHAVRPGGLLQTILHFILGNQVDSVYAWAALLLLLSVVAAFFKYQMRFAFISISRDAERDLRSKLFARIQEQSMAFYDRHGTGELLSRLTNDTSTYRDVLGPGLMYPLLFITIVFPGMVALFFLSVPLAIVSLVPLMIIPLLNFSMRNLIYKASHEAQKGLADLSNITQEHYSGIRIVKGYGIEPNLIGIFSQLGRSLIKVNIKLNTYQGLLFPFFTSLTKMVTVVIVMVAGYIVIEARGTLHTADFVTFMWIQSYIFFPVLMLAWVMPIYARGRASYERLLEIYDEPIEVKDEADTQATIPNNADIEFNHLSFRYPGTDRDVLNEFNLHIKSGTFVGITGPVGAGKTTLFRLLNREYEIPHGKIHIAGKDIHEYSLEAFGKSIVTVEQLPFLFSRSIADNVRFGKDEAQLDEVEVVAKYADLHETVLEFPEQYETVIGERGVTLSGGQKQRVAMARAFLVNGSILLLDDIFSAVDVKTEARIFEAIETNFKDKTILLITHRLSVLEVMDRIIYMEDGHIVEDGSPETLRGANGKYAAMLELQKLSK
ncbi:MAG TPA: ABC transporter ATP-binding protein, partial [Parachlamydiaceae bacterium]|nr:ABC transporter ATP-binding protein [Parachlamydiaceae bacterium]